MAFEYQGFASLGVNLTRQKYGPLDISNVFTSTADLKYYLTKGTFTEGVSEYWYKNADEKIVPYPYEGQVLATVINGAVNVYALALDAEGNFETREIAGKIEVDGKTIKLNADGKLELVGLPTDITGKTLVPSLVNGVLTWAEPDTSTAEGQAQEIGGLKTRATALETVVGNAESGLVKDVADNKKTIEQEVADRAAADTALEGKIAEALQVAKDYADTQDDNTVYDDTVLAGRVSAIEADYLKEADKYDDSALASRVTAVEDTIGDDEGGLIKDVTDNTQAIANEKTRAEAAEKALGERITAIDFVDPTELEDAIKAFATTAYIDGEIDKIEAAIAGLNHFTAKVVTDKAEMKDTGVLYLFKIDSATGSDVYEEYIVVDGVVTLIGDTTTDLSNYYNKTDIDGKVETLEGAIADEVEARETLTEEVAALKAVDNTTQAELEEYKAEVTAAIATAKSDAISDADGKLANKLDTATFTEFLGTNTTAIATAKQEAIDAAKAAEEAKGYAVASEIETIYATKDELSAHETDIENELLAYAKTADVNAELAKKIETGSISHSTETVAEDVTVDGTKLNIVVDAYTKEETLAKIQEKITEINGGESAGEVLSQLNSYKETNDARVGAIETKNTEQNAAIIAAQTQADKGVADAAKVTTDLATANTAIADNTREIGVAKSSIETVNTTLTEKINALENKDTGFDSAIVALQTTVSGTDGHASRITALEGSAAALASEDTRLAGLIDNKANVTDVYTKTEADEAIRVYLQAAKDSGEFDGKDGQDGTDGGHYTPSVKDNGNGTMTVSFITSKEDMPTVNPITINLPVGKDGTDGNDGEDGADGGYYTPSVRTVTDTTFKISFTASKSSMPTVGDVTITLPIAKDGEDGSDGVGIESIVQTTVSSTDGGENVITVTLTNGSTSTFKVKNGSQGSTGKTAFQYAQGAGYTGSETEFASKLANDEIYFGNDEVMPDECNLQIYSDGNEEFGEYAPVDHNHDGVYIKQTELNKAVDTALQIAKESGDFDGEDGKSPTITVNKVGSATTITATNSDGMTSTAQVQDGITYAEVLYVDSPADLEGVDIDKSKVYVCKSDGKQYAYKQVKTVIESGNLVPSSTPSSTQLQYGWVDGEGYCANRRLSSDGGTDKDSAKARTTGYIEVNDDDFLTVKNYVCASGVTTYFIAYDENKTMLVERPAGGINGTGGSYIPSSYDFVSVAEDGTATFKKSLAETFGVTGIKYLRISWGNTTVIEVYGKRVTTVTEWTAIRDFLPTDRSKDIDKLQEDVNNQNVRLTLLEQGRGGSSSYADAINQIRNYDKPLYDTLEPYLLAEDIDFDASKVTGYTNAQDPDGAKRKALVQRVYDDYNTLCATHPEYVRDVTAIFGGICSDNETYVRVYEFCEKQGRVQTDDAARWSERKPTIIIVSGIHQEWNGVYSMLEALRCLVTDDALRWIRRNFRVVILPVCNPYSFYGRDANGHYNANGIEIHNNFVVDFSNASDATHGVEPLTEVETNYINNVMRTYRDDAVCLLSCHSNATKGANFIWGSVATKMMVNTVLRLVDMMSYAWDKKYHNYRDAIDTLKTQGSNPQDDGDYRCGFANMSTSFGTEAKQALYHGFQGLNVEVYERFYLFDPNGTDAALAVSRGAEAYVNLLRLLAVTYDHNDRDKYAPTPAYEFEE